MDTEDEAAFERLFAHVEGMEPEIKAIAYICFEKGWNRGYLQASKEYQVSSQGGLSPC